MYVLRGLFMVTVQNFYVLNTCKFRYTFEQSKSINGKCHNSARVTIPATTLSKRIL